MRLHPPERSFEINPYSRWVYEYPRHLLAEPSPELLGRMRRTSPRQRLPAAHNSAKPCEPLEPGMPRAESKPLRVELGSGSGRFLVEQARRNPDTHFVGFELRYKRLVLSARKAENLALSNVWMVRERAEALFDYFPPNSLEGLYLNFPDPWPKVAQRKKRLVNPEFLARLNGVLQQGGWFQLRTDHSGYFLHILSLLRGNPDWKIRGFSNDLHRHGPRKSEIRTEFELMFAAKHKPIFYLHLEKPEQQE